MNATYIRLQSVTIIINAERSAKCYETFASLETPRKGTMKHEDQVYRVKPTTAIRTPKMKQLRIG